MKSLVELCDKELTIKHITLEYVPSATATDKFSSETQ